MTTEPEAAPIVPTSEQRPLIDKSGRRHRESVLRNWSPKLIAALGIRRLSEKEGE
jgi:hypothetical protein